MHENMELIESFYSAFQKRDHVTMASLYHPSVHFSDPVFPDLDFSQVTAMWQMFCETGTDLKISFEDILADDTLGSATWIAEYPFSQTGRKVRNVISADFEFRDGKIIRHRDSFKFWKWTRKALGVPGIFLGWSPPLQNKVRGLAARSLRKFMENKK